MRITDPAIGTLVTRLKHLHEFANAVVEDAEKFQKYKKEYGPADWYTRDARQNLEVELGRFRRELSEVYDLMHDRGLANFESAWLTEPKYKMHPIEMVLPVEDIDDWVPGINQYMRGGDIVQGFVTRRNPEDPGIGEAGKIEHDRESEADLQSDRSNEVAGSSEGTSNGNNLEWSEDEIEVFEEYSAYSGG